MTTPRHQDDVWAEGWKDTPYWLDGVTAPDTGAAALPNDADVVIIGSGYTGLNAAIECARAGRSTLVLEAQTPGYGCSTRNGGQISTSIKPSLEKLTGLYGAQHARAIRGEGERALEWIEDRITSEGIACSFRRVGRFHAAHRAQAYEDLARTAETVSKTEGIEAYAVPKSEQMAELGSEAYHGGVVYPRHASVDPALYHHGLLRVALSAGVQVAGHCPATDISGHSGAFKVTTPQGTVQARDVIVATNGYTTALTPWLKRRVIPIGSYMIATEELPAALMDRLSPKDRIASDSCKVVYYYRPSPDRKRILFGGRVSANETNPKISGPRLYDDMCRIYPELRDYKVSHSWMGTVAYTFDEMAHTGTHDGIHYAMGYCGSGVSMASYLGMRVGQKVLGLSEGRTAFDDLNFQTRPLYTGKPWFLPPMVAYYRWRDKQKGGRVRSMP
ncbi:MAG: NAD(P)/FAD-dependent oxidoreductase [Roseovarius sp.]